MAPLGTARCLGLPSALPLQSCLVPPHPCTLAAQSRAKKGTQRAKGTWALSVVSAAQGRGCLTIYISPAAPDSKTPGLPLWHQLRDWVPARPCPLLSREALKRLLSCWPAASLSHQILALSPRPPHPAHPMAGLRKGAQGVIPTVPVLGVLCQPPCLDSTMLPGGAPQTAQTAPPLLLCLPKCPGLWPAQNHPRAHLPLPSHWLLPMMPVVPLNHHCLKNATCLGLGSSHHHQPEPPVNTLPLHLLSQMSPNPQV